MTYKIPIYLSKLIKKFPLILSGRKKYFQKSPKNCQNKKLINDFN